MYPDNAHIDIVRFAIPDLEILDDDFRGEASIRGVIFKKSAQYDKTLIALQKNLSNASRKDITTEDVLE